MKPVIEARNIAKKFSIGHHNLPYLTFRESLIDLFKPQKKQEDFWALQNISFDVFPGESIGIIGKNGSGKSTLLKILSKVTPPTKGKMIIQGSMSSMLEIGTGFHPELNGLENIYLNGSILGMRKKEIKSKIDEIVDFAQVEKFLHTPLKRYSSGMQLRLAFAVAAFLEPDIMVIDEVLAVGDSAFQKKCLKKMEQVRNSGRTILFVSHNLQSVESICQKSILLEKGKLRQKGATRDVIATYLNTNAALGSSTSIGEYLFNMDKKDSFIWKVDFFCDGKPAESFYMGCEFKIRVHFKSEIPLESPVLGLLLFDNQDNFVLNLNNENYGKDLVTGSVKEGVLSLTVPSLPLIAGFYKVGLSLGNKNSTLVDVKESIMQLVVERSLVTKASEPLNLQFNKLFVKDLVWRSETRD